MLHIFTLTYNGVDLLKSLKESIVPALSNQDYIWYIKDNASTDNTFEIASSWGDKVKVIKYKDNLQNFSQGCNLLFNEASPNDKDYILLLNNDIIFNDTTSINKMINIMEKDPSIGVVGARLLYTNTNKLQHAGVVFDNRTKAPLHFRLNEDTDLDSEKNRLFQVVTGAVLLTKAEYYRNAYTNSDGNNGMDQNYFWGFDDVDLCLSIRYNLEKKVVYCGSTNIYHEDSKSLKKIPTNRLFLPHNMRHLHSKWLNRCCFDRFIYENNKDFNLYRK